MKMDDWKLRVFALGIAAAAWHAQTWAANLITDTGTITLDADTDVSPNNPISEGVAIRAQNTTTIFTNTNGTSINTSLGVSGGIAANSTLGVTGLSSLNGGATISGTTSINASVNAATNINTGSSTAAVIIGNSANITNINGGTNNIGVATANSINTVGNTSAGTSVTARGGTSTLSVANGAASLTAGPTLATNGSSGTTSGSFSGGLTVYNSAQTIAAGTTIPTTLSPNGILAGKTYQNRLNGNVLVDGNVYINGTLTTYPAIVRIPPLSAQPRALARAFYPAPPWLPTAVPPSY
ncbi:MAG: hypothetical protein ABI612_10440 [Betaproteobacteria bacterium]